MSSADTETPTEETATEDNGDGAATDERREGLLAELTELLGDDLVASHVDPGHELFIRVPAESWKRVHKTLRDEAGFTFFDFLSAIDWLPSPFGKSEDSSVDVGALVTTVAEPAEMETGHAGGDSRFQVFSRLVDLSRRSLAVVVKADVAETAPGQPGSVESIVGVFPGANWHEREVHEMFGIGFEGHPYLEKLYLPTGFEGHPLRKDFPLLARHVKPWPGIVDVEPMPDEADEGEEDSE